MRILQVTPAYAPVIGGVEKHVQALSEHLVRQGHSVTVATLQPRAASLPDEVYHGVTIRRFDAISVGDAYRMPRGLLRFLRQTRNQWDVVHVHNYHAPLIPLVALAGVPFVVTTHLNDTPHSAIASLLHIPYGVVGRWAVRRARAIICVTEAERERVTVRLGVVRERTVVIPNGFSERLMAARKQSDARDPHHLLTVGRLQPYKRVEDAIAIVAELGAPYRLTIVGEGPHRASLERLARRLGIMQRVEFVGRADDEALISWYRRAGVVLSLSEAEAFGMTVIEGLAAGARVVCSDIPAFRDLAAHFPAHVQIVGRRDVKAGAAAVIATTRGLPAPADVTAFTWDAVTDRVLAVYRRVTDVGHQPEEAGRHRADADGQHLLAEG